MLEKITRWHISHQVGPFCGIAVLSFSKKSQMIYAGNAKVATGKSQTGRVKLSISASAGKVQFLLGERKKSTGLGFTGSVTEARDN